MRKLLLAAAAAALLIPAVSAVAGDNGFGCSNHCPLAQKAGEHRAYGAESVAHTATPATVVKRNLDRI